MTGEDFSSYNLHLRSDPGLPVGTPPRPLVARGQSVPFRKAALLTKWVRVLCHFYLDLKDRNSPGKDVGVTGEWGPLGARAGHGAQRPG